MEWGDLCQPRNDDEAAVAHWIVARAAAARLAAEDRTNAEWQLDLAVIPGRLALTLPTREHIEAALAVLRNGRQCSGRDTTRRSGQLANQRAFPHPKQQLLELGEPGLTMSMLPVEDPFFAAGNSERGVGC